MRIALMGAVWLCVMVAGCGPSADEDPSPANDIGVDANASRDGFVELDIAVDSIDAGQPDVLVADAGAPDALTDVAPSDQGLTACDPALQLTSPQQAARPFDLVRFVASGGTGQWRFELLDDGSGAALNQATGAYLAGEAVGVVDTIILTDEGCLGEARLQISIVETMAVLPTGGRVNRGHSFEFEVSGGSGQFVFEMNSNRSGGLVTDAGRFTAGDRVGADIVRITDIETGQHQDVEIQVDENVELSIAPNQLYVPTGSSIPLTVAGGTGQIQIDTAQQGVSLQGTRLTGLRAGRYDLDLSDRFAGVTARVTVFVVESLQVEMDPFDDARVWFRSASPGDLNMDGRPDLLMAHDGADINAVNGGGLFVYHADEDGMPGVPTQVLAGLAADDEFGRDFDYGDLNGDGLLDLVVGARGFDPGMSNAGGAFIYLGQPDGLFSPEPVDILTGIRGEDRLGHAVAVCDFNGDGRMDIASAVQLYEDRMANPVETDQGAIFIFLGYEDGFLAQPDQIVLGKRLGDDGSWSSYRSLQMGTSMAAGDINGDGFCDLAVGSTRYNVNNVGNAGAVAVLAGVPGDATGPGGVTDEPAMLILADSVAINGGAFGRRVQVLDFNADGLSDILVGENGGDTGGRDRGAAYIFLGSEFDAVPTTQHRSVLTADFSAFGESDFDNFGIAVTAGDVTGDGVKDFIVGAYVDDLGPSNSGTIYVYAGGADGVPGVEPIRVITGQTVNARLGESIAVVGDLNGDGLNDLVAHANMDSSLFLHAGRTFAITQEPELDEQPEDGVEPQQVDVFTPIDYPRNVGGARFGTGVALVGDVTGDGFEDIVASAPNNATTARRSGGIWLYRGQPGGGFDVRGESLGGFPNHGENDLTWRVAPIGDFDGDGHDDFAVLLRDDERPTYSNLSRSPWSAPAPACLGRADCTDGRNCVDGGCRGCNADANCPGAQICRRGDCVEPDQCEQRGFSTGGVYIFRGGPDAFTGRPAFAHWGATSGTSPEVFSGGFDFNGDGLGDIVVGAYRFDGPAGNDSGAAYVISGRPLTASADDIQVICDTYYNYVGTQQGGNSGRAVVAMGDVNGDGCDEFALGSRTQDRPGIRDEGAVRIVYGFGAPNCPPAARLVRMATGEQFSQAGWSLASGDVDGDGLPDLAVGSWQRRTDNIPVGGAWLVPGHLLRDFPLKSVAVGNAEPPELLNELGADWLIQGGVRDAQAGYAVGISGSYVAVGAPRDRVGGVTLAGSVRVYRVTADGVLPEPVGLLIGETERPNTRIGQTISGGRLGGQPAFAVGADYGGATGLNNGSVYVMPLQAD